MIAENRAVKIAMIVLLVIVVSTADGRLNIGQWF